MYFRSSWYVRYLPSNLKDSFVRTNANVHISIFCRFRKKWYAAMEHIKTPGYKYFFFLSPWSAYELDLPVIITITRIRLSSFTEYCLSLHECCSCRRCYCHPHTILIDLPMLILLGLKAELNDIVRRHWSAVFVVWNNFPDQCEIIILKSLHERFSTRARIFSLHENEGASE